MATIEEMTIQCHLDALCWFPKDARDLHAHTTWTIGELGEFIGLLKKCEREQLDYNDPTVRGMMAEELADTFTHLLNCAAIMNINLEGIYEYKRQKNIERWGEPDHDAAISRIHTLNGGHPESE